MKFKPMFPITPDVSVATGMKMNCSVTLDMTTFLPTFQNLK